MNASNASNASNYDVYIDNLHEAVKKYELDFSILDGLSEGACFSGSTVLQAIMGQNWFGADHGSLLNLDPNSNTDSKNDHVNPSDLDIYIHQEDVHVVKQRILNAGYHMKPIEFSTRYGKMRVMNFFKWSDTHTNEVPGFMHFLTGRMVKCPVALQIDVVIIDGSIDDYINNFDLDICRNSYDGKTLKIGNLDGISKRMAIYTKNEQWLMKLSESDEKMITVYELKKLCNYTLLCRINKYRRRGFVISGYDENMFFKI